MAMFPPLYGYKNAEDCSNFVCPKMVVSPKTCILNGQIQENVGSHTFQGNSRLSMGNWPDFLRDGGDRSIEVEALI